MHVKSNAGRVFDLPSPDEEAKIREGITGDADTWALTDTQLNGLHPLKSSRLGHATEDEAGQSLSVCLSPEVVAFFKSSGDDWQIRINEVLKAYVAARQ